MKLTMGKKRKQSSPEFQSKVALDVIRDEETVDELTAKFKIHPTMFNKWQRALLNGAADLFHIGQKA